MEYKTQTHCCKKLLMCMKENSSLKAIIAEAFMIHGIHENLN